jgi:hypothetical protein
VHVSEGGVTQFVALLKKKIKKNPDGQVQDSKDDFQRSTPVVYGVRCMVYGVWCMVNSV